MVNIQAGYQIIVTSYAGDMDYWNTSDIDGLTLPKVKALKKLLEIVERNDTYSNDFTKDVQIAANYLFTEENGLADYYEADLNRELGQYEDYAVADLLNDLIGSAENYDCLNTLYNYSIYLHKEDLVDLADILDSVEE